LIELRGKYNIAKVFTDSADGETIAQILNLLNQAFVAGSKIRVMRTATRARAARSGRR